MSARILVVDDEPSVRSLVRDILELDNYEVAEAADGQEALDLFRSEEFALVVLDIMMPGISGLDVLRDIRSTIDVPEDYPGSDSETPVILLTAASDDDTTWEGWTSGASVFIAKPFDPSNLLEWVERTMADPKSRGPAPGSGPDNPPHAGGIDAEFRGLSD